MKRSRVSRRDVLRGGLAAAALGLVHSACSKAAPATTPAPKPAEPPPKRRILILGGTGFLGPKTVEAALARGHTVTIFNRGKREKIQPLEFNVEHLYGNRDPNLTADDAPGSPKGLEQLVGREFDVVIDNSGYFPRMVKASAELLAKQGAKQYIFISSISAYDENPAHGGDETTRLAKLADPTVETMGEQFENYGGAKVLCEQAVQAAMPAGATIVRPGYIVGPGDPTDRFTYWPMRAARGGDMLAPGAPDDPLQWIDVRDLAEWLVRLAEQGTTGAFNAIGPATPARWGDVLETCVAAAPGAKLVWVPAAWLENAGQGGEDAFPIWVAPTGKFVGFHRWNNDRAEAAGLTFRPIDNTVKAILDWFPKELERRVRVTHELTEAAKAKGTPPPKLADPTKLRVAPTFEREQELLAKWRAEGQPAK
ncbi:MAG: NAD-dependent epimerase/dehydratase family protein [Kofleriaceae bacterium]|nr:NAD-dependent epimerase/dehydratase family protein [Kofleriaceae bacterium]